MNRTRFARCIPLALLLAALPALAKDPPKLTPEQQAEMEAYQKAGTPGAPHAAMAKMAGNYDMVVKSWPAPGADPEVEQGTAMRAMILDGRVMTEDAKSTMMGQPFTGHGMQGFDNVTGKYWSTWNDSLSTGIMVSEGSCEANGACTYTGSWNDPVKKSKFSVRMTTKWTSPTVQLFEMFGPGPDGKEFKMMEITYTKKA